MRRTHSADAPTTATAEILVVTGGGAGTVGTAAVGAQSGAGGAGLQFSIIGISSYYATGGSGIVIIRYLTGSISATGGIITTSGSYTIHTFTVSGTFSVN